ncbi:MAG: Ni/Fe hydrogenase subunit alpha [Bdellovibrionaceae bacterium]|nr:Ni/Fe hydrogenase subunit alpha [Pseudobdellovibrionaceae bacterium]
MGRKITIDPVTRVEGHGKVTIHLDENNKVTQARLHIVEFRGFEKFIQGRPYWEAIVLVQRLCGICPVSHHLCAAKAMDRVIGVPSYELTETADLMRRLMHYGQFFQSHVLHFFHLSSPDLLFGVNDDPVHRNIIGVIQDYPEIATKAVMMRKFGQEIIQATAGKKIHGTGAIPGGINKHLSEKEKNHFLTDSKTYNADIMVEWAQEAVELFKDYHRKNKDWIDGFACFDSNYLSLVRKDGALDLYDGGLRAIDSDGNKIFDHVSDQEYHKYITENVRSWSYMKFPYLNVLGAEKGWYRVGPLARLNTCDFIPSPLAQKEFEIYRAYTKGKPHGHSMHMHWARLIEVLHAAEVIRDILHEPNLYAGELLKTGTRTGEGVGIIEAPRGTLFHHYRVNEQDLVTECNLIVSTTSNNEAMNLAVRQVAESAISGQAQIQEGMLNQVEVAIRAYDPCLSCATHALGQMPLRIDVYNHKEQLVDQVVSG